MSDQELNHGMDNDNDDDGSPISTTTVAYKKRKNTLSSEEEHYSSLRNTDTIKKHRGFRDTTAHNDNNTNDDNDVAIEEHFTSDHESIGVEDEEDAAVTTRPNNDEEEEEELTSHSPTTSNPTTTPTTEEESSPNTQDEEQHSTRHQSSFQSSPQPLSQQHQQQPNTPTSTQSQFSSSSQPPQTEPPATTTQSYSPIPTQPYGWRVKLYRLNADGGWDDCGTGRIRFRLLHTGGTVARGAGTIAGVVAAAAGGGGGMGRRSGGGGGGIGGRIKDRSEDGEEGLGGVVGEGEDGGDAGWLEMGEEDVYREVGEPILCMKAEVSSPPSSSGDERRRSSSSEGTTTTTTTTTTPVEGGDEAEDVLLRTRVLLRDVYQRQGDSIITWNEPFLSSSSSQCSSSGMGGDDDRDMGNGGGGGDEEESRPIGVDLALSFQDNAGCLDIWSKIKKVQTRAREIVVLRGSPQLLQTMMATDNDDEDDRGSSSLENEHQQEYQQEQRQQQQQQHEQQHEQQQQHRSQQIEQDGNGTLDPKQQGFHSQHNRQDSGLPAPSHNDQDTLPSTVESDTVATRNTRTTEGDGNDHQNLWERGIDSSTAASPEALSAMGYDIDDHGQEFNQANAVLMAAQFVGNASSVVDDSANTPVSEEMTTESDRGLDRVELPKHPKIGDLEAIAYLIAKAQPSQREAIASFLFQSDCAYIMALLSLFPAAEAQDDYHPKILATIIKSIILLNCSDILEFVASDGEVFEKCCCCLEYDPDLRCKANHRWFIRNRLKFRTVLRIKDEELIETIHKSFRISYIRDTLLRPTMDESSLQTLGSILDISHRYILQSVCSENGVKSDENTPTLSYLLQIIRMLGQEIIEIRNLEWQSWCKTGSESQSIESDTSIGSQQTTCGSSSPSPVTDTSNKSWEQHLAPQDKSLSSRKIRRRGCLSFLRELFNMVRMSVDQSDKNAFLSRNVMRYVCLTEESAVSADTDLGEDNDKSTVESASTDSSKSPSQLKDNVNLLSLLGAILSDPNTDVCEKAACLEILSSIAMHNPSFIRKQCLAEFQAYENRDNPFQKNFALAKPQPNKNRQVIFHCDSRDLLLSLLFVMAVGTDAGIILQALEIIRVVLEPEGLNESNQLGGASVVDNGEDLSDGGSINNPFHSGYTAFGMGGENERNKFLNMFFEHYVAWLVAPFQYYILISSIALPYTLLQCDKSNSLTQSQKMYEIHEMQENRGPGSKGILKPVLHYAVRSSFSVELIVFCLQTHCERMKRFVLTSRVLLNVLQLMNPKACPRFGSGDRCLKLAALRCLKAILMLKDESYYRHIVKHNLFAPVFDAFRANPIGDNLVSSAIIEICDFINNSNIMSLIDYIVTQHFDSQETEHNNSNDSFLLRNPTLEEVANPYVDTLNLLRKKYEDSKVDSESKFDQDQYDSVSIRGTTQPLSERAMEAQRKFREADEEDSYFNDDDDDDDDDEQNVRHLQHVRPPSPVLLSPPSSKNNSSTTQDCKNDVQHHPFLNTPAIFRDI